MNCENHLELPEHDFVSKFDRVTKKIFIKEPFKHFKVSKHHESLKKHTFIN